MARGESKYKISNYTGEAPMRSEPANQGELRFTPAQRLEVRYKGTTEYNHAPLWAYGLDVTTTGPKSCRASLFDRKTASVVAAFDVATAANALTADLFEREQIVAAAEKRNAQVAAGSWWLVPNAFKGLGLSGSFSATETHYLGGWSGHPKTYTGKLTKIVVIDRSGVSLRGLSAIFTIPWDQVLDLEVEGPEAASKRVTAGRVLALGVFALAAKKKQKSAVLIAKLRSGEEAIFQTEKYTAPELRAKLVPIISQLRKANASPPPTAQPSPPPYSPRSRWPPAPKPTVPPPAAPVSVADELKKLAGLKDAGLLTDEEFAGQKAKLLGS